MAVLLPFLVVAFQPAAPCAGSFSWPVSGDVIRGFEKPVGPYGEGGHQGVDIGAPAGEVVEASGSGTVTWVGELPRGRFVTITHAGGVRTTYLDLEGVSVTTGQRVGRGQPIGTVGGLRDSSSAATHLHFDAYMNGSPVDPRLLVGGVDTSSYIRLRPVDGAGSAPASTSETQSSPGFWRAVASPFTGAWHAVTSGAHAAWDGVASAGKWVASGWDQFWDQVAYPALRASGRWVASAASSVWNNKYVKAVVAGLAAAAVIVVVIVVVVITLPVSLTVGVIAGIVAGVACLGTAIYYAATHSTFSFAACFFKSLSAGIAVAATVLSFGSLSAAFSAGWAEMGLLGALKCAAANGALSAVFEGSMSYLFSGQVSLKRMAVAFAIGALSGPVGKALKDGLLGSRVVQALLVSVSEGRVAVSARTAILFIEESGTALKGMITVLKDGATAYGGRAIYLAFSGAFGASVNIAACITNGKPITFSGLLASFMTGAVMAGIGLTFGGRGLEGLLSRFGMLKDGLGGILRRYGTKLLTSGIRKGINSGLESGFKRVFHEEEPAVIKEE